VAKAPGGVAEVGNGIERDVGHGLAEYHVEGQYRLSTGARGKDRLCAKVSAEVRAKREPVSAVYSATSPSVMVRGVACTMAWPTWKVLKEITQSGLFAHLRFLPALLNKASTVHRLPPVQDLA
jgi:hypothetical protein